MRRFLLCLALTLPAAALSAAEPTEADRKLARQSYERGLELMKTESWGRAAEEFKAALQHDPQMVMAHYNLGQCRMAEKRFVEAVTAYKGAQEAFQALGSLSEKDRAARERVRREEIDELRDSLRRADSFATRGGNPDQIRMRIEERLRVLESMQWKGDPSVPPPVPAEFRLALGSAYFRQNKLTEAEAEYRAAVAVNPKLGAAHNNLAVICLMTGRADEAALELAEAEKNGVAVNPRLKADIEKARGASPR